MPTIKTRIEFVDGVVLEPGTTINAVSESNSADYVAAVACAGRCDKQGGNPVITLIDGSHRVIERKWIKAE